MSQHEFVNRVTPINLGGIIDAFLNIRPNGLPGVGIVLPDNKVKLLRGNKYPKELLKGEVSIDFVDQPVRVGQPVIVYLGSLSAEEASLEEG